MYFTLLLMVENNVADLSCVVVPCKDFRYSKFNCKENFLFPKISFDTFSKNGLQRFHNILNHFESKSSKSFATCAYCPDKNLRPKDCNRKSR